MKIYNPKGVELLDTPINVGSKYVFNIMKEDYITLKFSLEEPIFFPIGSYVFCDFGQFVVCDLYKPSYNTNTNGYDYELRLDKWYYAWKNYKVKYTPDNGGLETSFKLTAKLEVQLSVICGNLSYHGLTFKYENGTGIGEEDVTFSIRGAETLCDGDGDVAQLMTYDGTNIIDSLTSLAEKWGCEWWVEDSVVVFGKADLGGDAVDMAYGIKNADGTVEAGNLQSLSASQSQETFANRIYPFGSSRNVPSYYRKELKFRVTNTDDGFYDSSKALSSAYFANNTFSLAKNETFNETKTTKDKELSLSCPMSLEYQGTYNVEISATASASASSLSGFTISILDDSENVLAEESYTGSSTLKFTDYFRAEKNGGSASLGFSVRVSALVADDADISYNISVEIKAYKTVSTTTATFEGGGSYTLEGDDYNDEGIFKLHGHTPSIGAVYELSNIKRSIVPASYFTYDSDLTKSGVIERRIMLPQDVNANGVNGKRNYIDAKEGMLPNEVVEAVVVFDGVYPKYESSVSSVSTEQYTDEETLESGEVLKTSWDAYRITGGLNFSSDYLISGETLKARFTSGSLNGMEFELIFNPEDKSEKDPSCQVYEIVRNEDYGRPLPDDVLRPKVNDTFVLFNFDINLVGDSYVPLAERELLDKVKKYIEKTKVDSNIYTADVMTDYMMEDGEPFVYELGQRVRLIDSVYFESGSRDSRIIGWEYNLDMPWDTPRYIIGEKPSYSRLGELEDSIKDIEVNGLKYDGGTGNGGSVYLIKYNDHTRPNDTNAYSARRSDKNYLSKQNDDVARGKITFNRGIKSLGVSVFGTYKYESEERDDQGNRIKKKTTYDGQRITEEGNIVTGDYSAGALGAGSFYGRYGDEHDTYLELDRLFVRKKAQFTELEIDELTSVGGQILITPASEECAKVEAYGHLPNETEDRLLTEEEAELDTTYIHFYRCYFVADDGERSIENKFALLDQVRCQEWNIDVSKKKYEDAKNRYWWRLVIGVGDDYIDLSNVYQREPYFDNIYISDPNVSKSGMSYDSDVPSVGDTMVLLGNRLDEDRQKAIMISAYGGGAPYIAKYTGINDFSLGGCEVSFDGFEGGKQIFKEYGSIFFGDSGNDPVEYIRFTHADDRDKGHGTLEICASSITLISGDTKEDIVQTFDKLNGDVNKIKEQNDKEYTIWFGDYVPTLSNEPASNWSSDEYSEHVQDILYNKEAGTAYRFENTGDDENPTYEWVEITDAETLRALELVKKKSTVHFQTSLDGVEPPYNVGDTWSNATYYARDEEGNVIYDPVLDEEGNPTFYPNGDPKLEARMLYDNDFLVCVNAKGVGESFDINDWRPTNWFSRAIFNQETDKITQSVTNMVQLSKEDQKKYADELAVTTKNEAAESLRKALYGDGDDVESSVFYNISVAQQTADSITQAVYGLDKDGNKVEGAGAVFQSNFATMFASAYDESENTVKRAEIATFIKKDANGNIESGVGIKADQIDFSGGTINLSADEVNINSDAINIGGTDLPSYIGQFYSGGAITAPISGGVSGFLDVADGTALTWTGGILTSATR